MKSRYLLLLALVISSFFLFSCGGGGSGASKSPQVVVAPDTDPASDGSSSGSGSSTVTDGDSAGDSPAYVVIIKTDSNGRLNINNEAVDADLYIPSSESSASVSVTDEHGNNVNVSVSAAGEIKILPGDGTVEGVYTVVINTGDREYLLIVAVDSENNPSVTIAVSYPSGSGIILDLDNGNLIQNDTLTAVVSSGGSGNYSQDSTVSSITVTDRNGNSIPVEIDPVTGDIITGSSVSPAAPFSVVIIMADGRVISFQTDSNGQIAGNISVAGRGVIVDLTEGSLSVDGVNLTLTEDTGSGWTLEDNVEIISATAGGGTISVPAENIKVDSTTGDIMITGGGTSDVPSGPYEVRVSVDGKDYVIKTGESGNITAVIPGNILFDLHGGFVVHSGDNILEITSLSGAQWLKAGGVDFISAKDSSGRDISFNIDSSSGDIVTAESTSGEVTFTLLYTDSNGNQITYTFVIVNGSAVSYMAEISEPGPDFDFSTVTNVRISLKVTDEKTGLPLGQVSVRLLKADGSDNWQGFTNNSGISVFTATVDAANKTARVIVSRSGYETVVCDIQGIGRLIEFGRNISMKPEETAAFIDSDGDGVSDEDDEFPGDPSGAKRITGVYTVAFEDLYPQKGDADFNDVVIRLTLEEKIDSQNRLRGITIRTGLLASGAGYDNKICINVYGHRITLIDSPRTLLGTETYRYKDFWGRIKEGTRNRYNSRPMDAYNQAEAYLEIPEVIKTVVLNVPRTEAMPYDPFIICNGVEGREVHLPFVKTPYTGKRLDSDGFPWAILVPHDWSWPYESGSIFAAYPEFDDWYLNNGNYSSDWYLRPDSRYVYEK